MQNFMKKILILGVDFDQYFRSEYSIQIQYSHRNIGQNQPKNLIFFMLFCTLLYKHIFNRIAKKNYVFAPKICVYRLISFQKVDFAKSYKI